MKTVRWRLHLRSSPAAVFELISTDEGRSRFWAESAIEQNGSIEFIFPNGYRWRGEILQREAGRSFTVKYIGGSVTSFVLEGDGAGGTLLTLTDEGVREKDYVEVSAGWVSVLMALKAVADFGVDLRNHDSRRTWDSAYADN